MTFSTATNRQARRIHGFTLVEMLVVIGIIVLLIGILAPALNIAYTHSIRNRMMLDIQSMSTALEAYKSDMRIYPTLDYNDTSGVMTAAYPASVLLCNALIAPLPKGFDGTDGPGFTTVPNGQVYGPYLEPSRFKLVADPAYTSRFFIADRYNHPILYFLANKAANIHGPNGYVNYVNPTSGGTAPM
ncbi:MAG TPA: prepilin-type N-terminal cleavage/methylation domain-containing protein, partial [Tepidisphaeraceae bacterium]|nr:prepilin-type N-terminal cleavage/methylation domain-containing protein [Tepidisphaeraceae bacterium]